MELTLYYPKTPLNHVHNPLNNKIMNPINHSSSTPSIQIQVPSPKSQHEKNSNIIWYSLPVNPTSSSIRIQLPLCKPQKPRKKIATILDLVHDPSVNNKKNTTCSDILQLMDSLKLPIQLDLYISLVKECTKKRDHFEAIRLHNHIQASGISPSLHLLNMLLLMFVSCDCFEHACYLFDKMPVRKVNAWVVMIAGCVENGKYEEALHLFVELLCGYKVRYGCNDSIDFMVSAMLVCVLKACVETTRMDLGTQIHGWAIKLGYSKDLVLSSFLIRFYGKLGCSEGGDIVFGHVFPQNTVVWTARIMNYCDEERFNRAVDVFKEMGRDGVKKSSFTLSGVLKACGRVKDGGCCGKQVHVNAVKSGLDLDGYVQCGLIDMYGKCGLVKEARQMFDMIGEKRNVACWNALLTCYVEHGHCVRAVKLLYEMRAAGVEPPASLLKELRVVCSSCITLN